MTIRERIGAFVEAPRIQRFITALIVLNAISLGLETSPEVRAGMGDILAVIDQNSAGKDAGELVDGKAVEIPVHASIKDFLNSQSSKIKYLLIFSIEIA